MSAPKFTVHLLALVALFAGTATQAQAPKPTTPVTAPVAATDIPVVAPVSLASAMEIQKINENMTILSARLAQLELQSKIAVKQKEIAALGVTTTSALGGLPSVVAVTGINGKFEALLVFPGGVLQRVRPGDVIGDRKALTVTRNEVVLSDLKGKNPQRLAFGTAAVSADANSPQVPTNPMAQTFNH